MFVDFESRPEPPPWNPAPRKAGLSKRAELVLLWAIGFLLLAWALSPIAGYTIFQAIPAVMRK